MDIYDILEKIAELKSKDGKSYNFSRARLKENYNQFVDVWKAHYRGNVTGINTDTGFNGEESYPIKRRSMRVAKLISEKWSTGLFSEAFKVTLKDDIETEKFKELEKKIDFRSKLNQSAIFGYAEGTSCLLASADIETDQTTQTITGGKVKLDVIKYDSLFPLSFDQNDIQSIAFVRQEQIKDKTVYTISIHSLENGKTVIENIIATVKGDNVEFTTAETIKQSQIFNNQMYAIIKPNIANDNTDILPFGQSIFSDSLAACIDIDLAADLLRRDVEEGAQVTFIGRDLLFEKIGKNGNKKKLFENAKGKFFVIPQKLAEGGNGNIKQLFEKSVPEIRVNELWQVIKDSLNWACVTSGLGKGSLDIIPMATATQVITTESEKMQNINLHQQYLEGQLIKIVKALCELSTMTNNPIDSTVVYIVFEDSIIQDTTSEKNLAMREIDMGVISKQEYRVKFYGETPEEAAAKIMEMTTADNPFDFKGLDNEL
ncbi:MAG: phage portal protein [Treponema sp.]|nr:phage portal protein [Treponema sp.]